MRCLHRQSFASIQLPSISGPINEGARGESRERAERTGGGQRPGVGGGTEWE